MAQHAKNSYAVKVITRVLEYSADKNPEIDEPDRVIEDEPVYLSPEDLERRENYGNDQ